MAEDAASSVGAVRRQEGLRIVPPHEGHLALLLDLGADEEARRWGDAVPVRDPGAARAWVSVARDGWAGQHRWAPRRWVAEVATGPAGGAEEHAVWRPAGVVEYRPDGHGAAEVGYAVHPDHRGRRVATGALGLALGHAFDEDDVVLLRWRAEVDHWASRRVAWRLGFSVPVLVRGLLPGWGQDTTPRDGWIATLHRDEPREPAHPWREIPVLAEEDGDVRLRPWRADADDAAALASVDDVARQYVGTTLPGPGEEAVRAWTRARLEAALLGRGLTWCIADARSDAALGSVSLVDLQDPSARGCGEVGFWLLPAGRGRGAVTQAVRLVTRYAVAELGVHRMAARTDERNDAAHRALLRAGFRWTVTEPQSSVDGTGDERHGTARFELLGDDAAQAAPLPGPPPSVAAAGLTPTTRGRAPGLPTDAPPHVPAPVPTLRTDGLVLRPWRAGDEDRIVEAVSDPLTRQYLPELPDPYGQPEAAAFLQTCAAAAEDGERRTWAVADAADDRVLGAVSLTGAATAGPPGEIGYWAHPDARGRGVTTAAVRAVVRYAVAPVGEDGLGLPRVWVRAAASNRASRRVAAAAGLQEVGRDRQAEVLRDGTVDDLVRLDLLASEVPTRG
ncbi:GNAT family N-acetyltransferase [Serinicoccus chungangensis]|uniref:GNAT family N-acetyltransferase n=1 Tax=Serinicoccus chungangensis TaxID=767452 RepID=UPI001119DC83|nr:GNAT family N-acetyltransferase [Serinicoccus chungangensis]